jgi:hypothetical protein
LARWAVAEYNFPEPQGVALGERWPQSARRPNGPTVRARRIIGPLGRRRMQFPGTPGRCPGLGELRPRRGGTTATLEQNRDGSTKRKKGKLPPKHEPAARPRSIMASTIRALANNFNKIVGWALACLRVIQTG